MSREIYWWVKYLLGKFDLYLSFLFFRNVEGKN